MPEPAIPLESIDPDAQKVIKRLTRNGYDAYMVGGCVRDLLLGRKPKDFDLATSATPAEVRDLFRNCRIIGRRFRLAHVFFGSKIIETATFRANPREVMADENEGPEDEQADLLIQRDNVFGTAEEDALRRDFTMNGLFYDIEKGQVIDFVDGLADLKQRSVRTIGDPDIRFREDPVRILRAIKFAARLGFDIEDRTYQALITHREEIGKSAAPRVLEEIYRLLRGGAALESFFLLRETGVLAVLIPEVDQRLRDDPMVLDPYLRAVDLCLQHDEAPANAVLLCILCAPDLAPLLHEQAADRVANPGDFLAEVLDPILLRVRASRRDVERAKQIVLGQRRIWQLQRRGPKGNTLLQRDWFQEAMLLNAICRIAGGAAPAEALGALRSLHHAPQRPPAADPGAPATVEETLDEGRRRRRRRGRRRPPGQAGAAPPQEEGASEEEPVENEEAAIDAFTAALSTGRFEE